jgi:hypothetical protein
MQAPETSSFFEGANYTGSWLKTRSDGHVEPCDCNYLPYKHHIGFTLREQRLATCWTVLWCNDSAPICLDFRALENKESSMRKNDPNDTTRSYFRTQDRVFTLNGQWFFTTREGEVGPFRTREKAIEEVGRFVQERNELMKFQNARGSEKRQENMLALEILPKDEPDLTLDELLLKNRG